MRSYECIMCGIQIEWGELEPKPFEGRLAGHPSMKTGKGRLHYTYVRSKLKPREAYQSLVGYFRSVNLLNYDQIPLNQ